MVVSGHLLAPAASPPGNNPRLIEQESGWAPEHGLDFWRRAKSFPLPGFESRMIQHVAYFALSYLSKFYLAENEERASILQ
jgi:hypothetical protein